MYSTESTFTSETHRRLLLDTAAESLRYGLAHRCPLSVNVNDYDTYLQQTRATFVTLNKNGQLRGCIGVLQAARPLIEDVAENAYAAGFRDPRFPPVSAEEFGLLDIHISILNPAEAMAFSSESDLIKQLRPGLDGLILEEGNYRGTFLPSVWESLSDPTLFLRHLKQKAGLSKYYWSDAIKVSRYTTESFSAQFNHIGQMPQSSPQATHSGTLRQ